VPLPFPPQDLAFSVARWLCRGASTPLACSAPSEERLPPLCRGLERTRRCVLPNGHRARAAPTTFPLRPVALTTQNTFDWFERALLEDVSGCV